MALFLIVVLLLTTQSLKIGLEMAGSTMLSRELALALFYLLPSFFVVGLPLSHLAALLVLFARYRSDREAEAMMAAGIDVFRFVLPVLIVSLPVSAVTGWLALDVSPKYLSRLVEKIETVDVELLADNLELGKMVSIGKNTYFTIVGKDDVGRLVGPFVVSENEEQKHVLWARQAEIGRSKKNATMKLSSGGFEWSAAGSGTRGEFAELELDLSILANKKKEAMFAPWQLLTASKLSWMSESCKSDKIQCKRYRIALSKRMALSFTGLLMGLLALSMSNLRWLRRSYIAYACAIVVALIYYTTERAGMVFAEKSSGDPSWGPWLPHLILGILAVALLLRTWRSR